MIVINSLEIQLRGQGTIFSVKHSYSFCSLSILYGLQHFKSKPAAKKALLTALQGDGGLTVPENILKIERNLAAEYGVKNAAAEKEYQKQKLLGKERNEKERKKRQRDEEDLLAQKLRPTRNLNRARY